MSPHLLRLAPWTKLSPLLLVGRTWLLRVIGPVCFELALTQFERTRTWLNRFGLKTWLSLLNSWLVTSKVECGPYWRQDVVSGEPHKFSKLPTSWLHISRYRPLLAKCPTYKFLHFSSFMDWYWQISHMRLLAKKPPLWAPFVFVFVPRTRHFFYYLSFQQLNSDF